MKRFISLRRAGMGLLAASLGLCTSAALAEGASANDSSFRDEVCGVIECRNGTTWCAFADGTVTINFSPEEYPPFLIDFPFHYTCYESHNF